MSDRPFRVQRFVLAAALFLVTLMSAVLLSAQQAPSINEVDVFGDSLSDTGNVYRATNQSNPPSPPYFEGRYSNGRVWVEYLTQRLGVQQVKNLAYGGATTGNASNSLVPGLLSQVQSFTQNQRNLNDQALYILWAGANDYLQGATDTTLVVDNLTRAIALLREKGANQFLVPNLPDLGRLPATRSTANSDRLTRLTEAHNSGLRRSLKQLQQQYPDLQIVMLDAFNLYHQAIAQPSEVGLTNVTQGCLNGVQSCRQPDQFLFWDGIHPTTVGHRLLAESAFATLKAER